MRYQTPSPAIADLVNLKPDPLMLIGPDGEHLIQANRPQYPSVEELKQPKLKLAGRAINPEMFTPTGQRGYSAPLIRNLHTLVERTFTGVPENASFRYFSWSPNGTRIAFCILGERGLQLWSCDLTDLHCRPHGGETINNSLGGQPL